MPAVERTDVGQKIRYCLVVLTLCVGVAVGQGHGVAWADESGSSPSSSSSTGSSTPARTESKTAEGPRSADGTEKKGAAVGDSESTSGPGRKKSEPDDPAEGDTSDAGQASTESADEKPDSSAAGRGSHAAPQRDQLTIARPSTRSVRTVRTATAPAVPDPPAQPTAPGPAPVDPAPVDPAPTVAANAAAAPRALVSAHSVTSVPVNPLQVTSVPVNPVSGDPISPSSVPATAAAPAVTGDVGDAAAAVTTPAPPEPLSPIATLLQLPGRIVNAVLQFLDLTSAATGPRSPFNIAPINDLLFGAFRELEKLVGLHKTPAVQPVLPTMTYTGPTDRPTPTVAQFLNASTAAYGWGTTPGGMVPFTVNGVQLHSTNIFSGMSGKAWVTPQGQVIIAYQGTTGGTNLLVNPLITLAQLAADMQVILTGTTPLAFYDAVRFTRRVQEEAAVQGYAAEDVFVTGHSLGGWEAQFVSQRTGLAGIGFESPGMNSKVPGNGADALFVNIANYGSPAAFMATDLPGLQPFMPPYVPGGGSKPHYGPIVVIGDREAMNPMVNASAMFGKSLIGSLIFMVDFLGNFFQYHLMGVQAYHLDVDPDPGVVPWLGTGRGTVHTGYGELSLQELLAAASDDGILIMP